MAKVLLFVFLISSTLASASECPQLAGSYRYCRNELLKDKGAVFRLVIKQEKTPAATIYEMQVNEGRAMTMVADGKEHAQRLANTEQVSTVSCQKSKLIKKGLQKGKDVSVESLQTFEMVKGSLHLETVNTTNGTTIKAKVVCNL